MPDGLVKMPTSHRASGYDGGARDGCVNYDWATGLQIPGQACNDPTQPSSITCVTQIGTIAVVPTISNGLEMAILTNRRMIGIESLTPPGFTNATLFFWNTSTDSLITSIAYAPGGAQNPVAAIVNDTFWFQRLDGTNDQFDKYDGDGNFITSVSIVTGGGRYAAYETTTQLIYFVDALFVSTIGTIDPQTNVTGTLPLGMVFGLRLLSSPGFLYVDDGLSRFHVFSVSDLTTDLGTIDMSGGGWDGGFAYAANTGKVYFGTFHPVAPFNPEIWEVNPATATVDFVYDMTGVLVDDVTTISYDPIQGRLLATDAGNNIGAVIDPINRTVVCNPAITGASGFYNGVVCDSVSGKFYQSDITADLIRIWQ